MHSFMKENELNVIENTNLDKPFIYRQFDSEHMLEHLHEFPSECKKAYDLALAFNLPSHLSDIDNVVIPGMGGSAIGGDLVSSVAGLESKIPVQVFRGYYLPYYVNHRTLVISSSYSGNTEEVLSCFEQGLNLGVQNLIITSGGKLKEQANNKNLTVFSFGYKAPPRAALP
jgi:glucose/mannose-6-phosphate isomerase